MVYLKFFGEFVHIYQKSGRIRPKVRLVRQHTLRYRVSLLLRHISDAPEIKRELIYNLQSLIGGIIKFLNFLTI